MDDMEASMCSCDFDGEPLYPCNCKIVKARKDHKCCECRDIIKAGQKYEYVKGLSEGEWFVFKTCIICSNIRKDYCAPYEYLWEELKLALGDEII